MNNRNQLILDINQFKSAIEPVSSTNTTNKDQLNVDLNHLKSAFEAPRMYVSEFFDTLRNQVDIDCETLLSTDQACGTDSMPHDETTVDLFNKNRVTIINKINILEEECLSNLPENCLDASCGQNILESIENIEEKLLNLDPVQLKDRSEIDHLIYKTFQILQGEVLFKKTIAYLTDDSFYMKTNRFLNQLNQPYGIFGVLLCIEDEYIGERGLNKGYTSNGGPRQFTKETLKLYYLLRHLKSVYNENTFHQPVITISLNRKEKIECVFKRKEYFFFNCYDCFDPEAFTGMPQLRTFSFSHNYFTKLELNVFKPLKNNLKFIYFNNNHLSTLEPGVFEGLDNLKLIDLRYNGLKSLDKNLFNGLKNLEEIMLNHNLLTNLNAELFHGLNNLKVIYLNGNRLDTIDPGTFKGLYNLESLHLRSINIECLHNDVLAGLVNLKALSLSNNHLRSIDPTLFRDLQKLEVIMLDSNILSELDPGLFAGLSNLQRCELNNNQITWLDKDLFSRTVNLKFVCLDGNLLTTLDSQVFRGLNKLETIDLRRNKLVEVDSYLFRDLESLRKVSLANNKLTLTGIENLIKVYGPDILEF